MQRNRFCSSDPPSSIHEVMLGRELAPPLVRATMIFLLCGWFAAGCARDEPAEERTQSPPAVEATVAPAVVTVEPTPVAPQAAAHEDPYEDSLVLLAEGDPDSGRAPLAVQFEVESLIVDEISGARYTWDFGDGSPPSTEANPMHTYEKPGHYTATVGIVDASGQRGWDEIDILVEEPEDQDATP